MGAAPFPPRRAAHERAARAGRWAAFAAVALAPTMLDVALRGSGAAIISWATLPSALVSVTLWGACAAAAQRPWSRAAVAVSLAALLVVETWVHRFYGVILTGQVLRSALHAHADVGPVVTRVIPETLAATTLLAVVLGALLRWGAAAVPPGALLRSGPARAVVLGAASAASIAVVAWTPRGRGSPDAELARALAFARSPAEARPVASPVAASLGVQPAPRGARPAVLVVLTESVRAADYDHEPRLHAGVAAVVPERVVFAQARAVASYTAVSVAALFTGREQLAGRSELLAAPTFLHLAQGLRSTGVPLRTAYYSAHLRAVFEGRDVAQATDTFVTLESLLGHELDDEELEFDKGYDRLLTDRFVADGARHGGPGLTVLHFAGTHVPYFVDPADAPFAPWTQRPSWRSLGELHNAYKNAIALQDGLVARCVRAFVDAQRGGPYLVVFTSDHGEAFGEAGAIHHGQNLYAEQTHVPLWVAFGNGALRREEAQHLTHHAAGLVTHFDVVPTVLHALGAVAPPDARRAFAGQSWLAAPRPRTPLALTNCTSLFPCPLDTWGALDDAVLVTAQPWDAAWRCVAHAPAGGPSLELPESDSRCAAARGRAIQAFGRRPGGASP